MLDTNLIAHLRATVLTAHNRICTANATQGMPRPFVVLNRASGNTPRTLDKTRLFSRATFSIIAVADDLPDASEVANEIKYALDAFTGDLSDSHIESCRCVSEQTPVDVIDGDFIRRGMSQDFYFVFRDPIQVPVRPVPRVDDPDYRVDDPSWGVDTGLIL